MAHSKDHWRLHTRNEDEGHNHNKADIPSAIANLTKTPVSTLEPRPSYAAARPEEARQA